MGETGMECVEEEEGVWQLKDGPASCVQRAQRAQ